MKNNGNKMIECDCYKLKKLLEDKGTNLAAVSEEMGYNRKFLSMAYQRKVINKSASIMLEKIYGIKSSDYAFTKEEKEDKKPVNEAKQIKISMSKEMQNQLYNVIYNAVYNAITVANEGDK